MYSNENGSSIISISGVSLKEYMLTNI
jgi:hypothetical protein